LLDRLYPELMAQGRGGEFWRRFFLEAGSPSDPLFSHLPRFMLSARAKEFYAPEFRSGLGEIDVLGELRASLPARYFGWSSLNQAAYLEMTTLLSPYLLSSQGDRMAMAHGVEGRFPFLDHPPVRVRRGIADRVATARPHGDGDTSPLGVTYSSAPD